MQYHIAMTVYPAKVCEVCGKKWQPTTRYQAKRNKTCSKACAYVLVSRTRTGTPTRQSTKVTVACAVCGKPTQKHPSHLKRTASPTCSYRCNGVLRGQEWAKHGAKGSAARKRKPDMAGPKNPAWKGGVTYRKGKGNYIGPRYVRSPKWALPMARKDGYIMEHRLVMAKRVGRLLTREEVVNHINHDPRDNRPENLELYPTNGDHKRGEAGRFVIGVANRLHLP